MVGLYPHYSRLILLFNLKELSLKVKEASDLLRQDVGRSLQQRKTLNSPTQPRLQKLLRWVWTGAFPKCNYSPQTV
jgi:hypothetical protein